MDNRRQSRTKSKGLVSKLIAPVLVGAAALMPAPKAEGGMITLDTNISQDVNLYHSSGLGATDNFDKGLESDYSSAGSVDFYSMITGHTLSDDFRGIDSNSTFYTKLKGNNGLTVPINGNLTFAIDAPMDFPEHIWADIYKNGSLVTGNIDVRDYASKGTTILLSLANNSDVYNIDVRFVPEGTTLGMLGTASLAAGAFGIYNLITRRKEDPKE